MKKVTLMLRYRPLPNLWQFNDYPRAALCHFGLSEWFEVDTSKPLEVVFTKKRLNKQSVETINAEWIVFIKPDVDVSPWSGYVDAAIIDALRKHDFKHKRFYVTLYQ